MFVLASPVKRCVTWPTLAERCLKEKEGREKVVGNKHLMSQSKFAMVEFVLILSKVLRVKKRDKEKTRVGGKNVKRKVR